MSIIPFLSVENAFARPSGTSTLCLQESVQGCHEGTEVLPFAVDAPEGFGQGRRFMRGVASTDTQGNDELRCVDSFRGQGVVDHLGVCGFGGERGGGASVVVVGPDCAGAVHEQGGTTAEGTHAGK